MRVAEIKEIRHLVVVPSAFAGGRGDHDPPCRVRIHDGLDFPELFGSRHGGAAEFGYL